MNKIAFFMHGFNGGGAEKVTIITANLLAKSGIQVDLLMKTIEGPLFNMVNSNVNIIDLKITRKSLIDRGLSTIKNVWYLKKVMDSNVYDILFIVARPMCFVASLSSFMCRKSRTKLIGIIHNSIYNENNGVDQLKNRIIRLAKSKYYTTVVVSEDAASEYRDFMKNSNVETIYNPVVNNEILELSHLTVDHKWLVDTERSYKVLVTAGRLSAQKNHAWMIQMLKQLKKTNDVKLLILGEGPLKEELQKQVKDMKLEDCIDFVGFTSNPYTFFAKSDAFILTSNYEGLPTVLIEALACGCNIVSTNCPTGPREILDSGKYGWLVECGDMQGYIAAITECLEKPHNKAVLQERAAVFSYEAALTKYENLIKRAIGDK